MEIKIDLIPIDRHSRLARRRGRPLDDGVVFFVDHDTGNPNSTARNNVDYFKRTYNQASASAHLFVDDKEVIMCIPAFENPEVAFHVLYGITTDNEMFDNDSNDSAIGIELCYFPNDKNRTLKAYNNYIDVAVDLAIFHKVHPRQRVGHFSLDPARKYDPKNALGIIGKTYTDMVNDIQAEYERRVNMSTIPEWKLEGLKYLRDNGLINDYDYWALKIDEAMPVWAQTLIMARLHAELKGK